MKKSARIKPPPGLTPAASRFCESLRREYGIADAGGLALLEVATQRFREHAGSDAAPPTMQAAHRRRHATSFADRSQSGLDA